MNQDKRARLTAERDEARRQLAEAQQQVAEVAWTHHADEWLAHRFHEVADERDRLRDALDKIAAQQPKTLETLRKHGIVFDALGADPKNWQHVAFSIYNDLCEVDLIARAALAESKETT